MGVTATLNGSFASGRVLTTVLVAVAMMLTVLELRGYNLIGSDGGGFSFGDAINE